LYIVIDTEVLVYCYRYRSTCILS